MRKFTLMLLLAITGNILLLNAQEKNAEVEAPYRRSSLHTILLKSSTDFLNKELVINAYNLAPFPNKYNDHRLGERSFNRDDYMNKEAIEAAMKSSAVEENKEQSKDEKKAAKNKKKADKKKSGKKSDIQTTIAIKEYMKNKRVAAQLVAKWFDRHDDGSFNMHLIHERGSYDASAMKAQIAKGSIRGLATLKDAGEELISKTFVVVNKMKFVENEPIAYGVKEIALATASLIPNAIARQVAESAAEVAYIATKDGYSVWTTSYLFQLDWNDEIANDFYMNMWMDSTSLDADRKMLFDTTSIFNLKYVGYEKAKSLVLIGIGKELKDIIQLATIRNVDKVYTKLQKSYEVFKTKTPIYSVDPIIAKIGLKEALEGGDKFDVLEMAVNKKTGLTEYVVVGQVKVDKKSIWDNRYNMENVEELTENAKLVGTSFKGGGKKIMSGMLLRQVK